MKRRNFLKKLPVAVSIPFAIGGIPIRLMADNPISRLASQSTSDRVLIILQMQGGNDGLNTLIPVDKYDLYYSRRPNIAIPAKNGSRRYIPLDSTLPLDAQVGLHPDMSDMKALYDQGRVAFVQGVSYKNNNGSHFRGRDIWFMGGGADDYFDSGWVGRYLSEEWAPRKYPNDFPFDVSDPSQPTIPDPLAIEMGSDISLIFHQSGNIPTSISIDDPENFKDLVESLEGFQDLDTDKRGIPPDFLTDSPYWKEMEWILKLEDKSHDYAQRMYDVWAAGKEPQVSYPEKYPFNAPAGNATNPLSPQLKLIARMLGGGCKTRVFMIKIGGFDSHANQVENYDPTMGAHAALMYHVSSAMKAFQEDLRARGLEDKVLTVTTSEFGRRITSNGSFGTDHGTGGPIYVFGKGVKPGVVGKVPDLTKDNVELQYDYRQVFTNILRDWMLADKNEITTVFNNKNFIDGTVDGVQYEPLPLISKVIDGTGEFISSRFSLEDCYPNPAKDKTTLHFKVNASCQVTITLLDNQGKQIKALVNKRYEPGEYHEEAELYGLPAGNYIYQMKTLFYTKSKKLVVVK